MQTSPDLIRSLLFMGMLAMVLLSAFYLRQRRLPLSLYAFWGLIAIFFPIIGPFLVIWIQPGEQNISHQI